MRDLMRLIVREVSEYCTISTRWVNKSTTYPYCTFYLSQDPDENVQNVVLTIDVWDRSTSAKTVNTIAAQIRLIFDRAKFVEDTQVVWSHVNSFKTLSDLSPKTKRAQIEIAIRRYVLRTVITPELIDGGLFGQLFNDVLDGGLFSQSPTNNINGGEFDEAGINGGLFGQDSSGLLYGGAFDQESTSSVDGGGF